MAEQDAPFCYVAEKNGRCLGVTASDFEVKAFYAKFAGCEIKSLANRDEWLSYCKRVPFGEERTNG